MAAGMWKKIDVGALATRPSELEHDDDCYFAREYTPLGRGMNSVGTELVMNFKLRSTDPNFHERKSLKTRAAYQFAEELAVFLQRQTAVCHIPTSKLRGDPDYDPRFDYVLRRLMTLRPDVMVATPFTIASSHTAVHSGGERTSTACYRFLRWQGLSGTSRSLVIFDDVITSGSHFKACQRLVRENAPDITIQGAFWTVTVSRPQNVDPELNFD